MSAGFVETTINSTDLLSQATEALNFIADCFENDTPKQVMPAGNNEAPIDLKSLLTQAFISKMTMPPPDSDGSPKENRTIQENTQQTPAQSKADD
jgi:hypothetical protein